jgi:AraC-like DNA-binding protein
MAPRAQERVVAITCRPEYLIQQFLTHTNTDASVRLQALASAKEGRLTYLRGPLSARMLNVASNLVNQPYRGILGLIFTEALTLELLCTAVHDFASSPEGPIEEYGEHDLKCLNAAREYLMRTFSPAPTIRQVSRSAGMSETPLKRGFKAVFGETISEFSVRCRMQYALALIRDGQLPVSRIAESVGYSHQSTFATAFRRHFGVSPSELGSVGVSASIHQDGK